MLVVKVPGINGLGKTEGCQKAGNEILKALDEIYSSESGKIVNRKLLNLEEIHLDNNNIEEANKLIYENGLETFEENEKAIFLGGDHSISYSLLRGFNDFCKKEKKEPFLVVFDAHPDCMQPMREPSHEEWLRGIIEKGFPKKNIVMIGSRNVYHTGLTYLKENKIRTFFMKDMQDKESICDSIMEMARGKELYVSIDVDVLDPAFAPGTGFIEPGGMSSRELLYYLQRLALLKNLRGIDIVEINPSKDLGGRTVKIGAKILAEML